MDSNNKLEIRKRLVQKVGPWAFQSYPKDRWNEVSDKQLIHGALLKAKPEDRYLLLDLFDINQIKRVWERYAVLEDGMFHASNVWVAKNIFKVAEPEKYVRQEFRKSRRRYVQGLSY